MGNKIVFGRWEAAALFINAICARIFLNIPRPFAEETGTAAWLEALTLMIFAFIVFIIMQKLYEKFEGKDIMDICQYSFGSIGRVILGLMIMAALVFISSIILREYAEDLKVIAFTNTPISFVMTFLLATALFGACFGIETIVRFHGIGLPIIIAGLLFILLGVSPFYEVHNLFPVFGYGIPHILSKGFVRISLFSPLIYILLIIPFIKTHKNFKRVGYFGITVAGLLLFFTTLVYTLVYRYPISTESFLPVYQLARLVRLGVFFQRIESIFMFIWVASALLNLCATLFFITYTFKKTFKLAYSRPLLMPFAIIIFVIGIIPQSLMTAIYLDLFYNTYAGIITIAVPIIILITASIKKSVGKGEAK